MVRTDHLLRKLVRLCLHAYLAHVYINQSCGREWVIVQSLEFSGSCSLSIMSPTDVNKVFLTKKSDMKEDTRMSQTPGSRDVGIVYRWRSSWQAPITMIGLLFLGGAMAWGHHFLYQSLYSTETPDNFSQQRNTAYGTAFAFMAKACMIAAVVSAYTQYIWSDFRKKFTAISTIGSAFTAVSSVVSLLDPQFLWAYKTKAILAVLTW